jgi:uncharacterized membrane protein
MNAQPEPSASTQLCVLLACFDSRKGAAHARGALVKDMRAAGGNVVDDVVVTVDGKRRARVHDPRRVVAGTLTSVLTWGAFGLVAAGTATSLVIWAVLGALCGGAFAYASEHILTKSDLAYIGKQLTPDSSAVVAFVETADDQRVLAAASRHAPVTSAAVIEPDLSSHATGHPIEHADGSPGVSMTLLRYGGEHTARQATTAMKSSNARVELIVEAPPQGRPRVVSPTQGVGAMSKSDIVSWGGFGLVFGLIVGFGGNGGLFGALEKGVVTGVGWGLFGLVAGALYGLWAGRGASSRRIKSLRALLPPDTSTAIVWVTGASTDAIADQARAASEHVTLYFHPAAPGAVLETA